MTTQFSSAILDTHIAPGVSAFKYADIPDMSSWANESSHWIGNYFLNSALHKAFTPPMNAYAYNFIRRAQYAFSEHASARTSTLAFIADGGQSPVHFGDSLFHWECFLSQAWHAYSILIKAWKGKAFNKNDGSVEQRLNALYNQMKHVESRIDNAQLIPGATVPVWLENQGLRSIDTTLTFTETGYVLTDLARYADALSNPSTAREVLDASDPA